MSAAIEQLDMRSPLNDKMVTNVYNLDNTLVKHVFVFRMAYWRARQLESSYGPVSLTRMPHRAQYKSACTRLRNAANLIHSIIVNYAEEN